VEVRETKDEVLIFDGPRLVARHRRLAPTKDMHPHRAASRFIVSLDWSIDAEPGAAKPPSRKPLWEGLTAAR
jgi:hypothetical protein